MKSDRALVQKIRETVIYSRAILVAVASKYHLKRVIRKTWTGIVANSDDPDQTPQNAASDLGLHCLLKSKEVEG